eukprot:8098648-Pyramimonas_sp.AAC.1
MRARLGAQRAWRAPRETLRPEAATRAVQGIGALQELAVGTDPSATRSPPPTTSKSRMGPSSFSAGAASAGKKKTQ